MHKSRNILISPLNWGLGHASRLMPIIDYCINNNKKVIIAGNGESLNLIAGKYPKLIIENIPAPQMRYGNKKAIGFSFIFRSCLLVINIARERLITKRLVKKHEIDTIISDNRPGVFVRNINTIYITHQLNIYTGKNNNLVGKFLSSLHRKIIKKYSYCWIPDMEGEKNLAGRLSENKNSLNLTYIGPLSRFSECQNNIANKTNYEIVCIISGPEPQRHKFENSLVKLLASCNKNSLIIRGLPATSENRKSINNISFVNHCNDDDFYNYILASEIIISRSGYSTIMDLIITGKKAFLVPTPGQPEQEYLAEHLNKKHGFMSASQSEIENFDISKLFDLKKQEITFDRQTLKKVLALYL